MSRGMMEVITDKMMKITWGWETVQENKPLTSNI
jgi:hypothetical protein